MCAHLCRPGMELESPRGPEFPAKDVVPPQLPLSPELPPVPSDAGTIGVRGHSYTTLGYGQSTSRLPVLGAAFRDTPSRYLFDRR